MIAFAFGRLRKGVCGFLGRLPELRPGLLLLLALTPLTTPGREVTREQIGPGVQVLRGAVNGAWLERHGKRLAIYGDPRDLPAKADLVLFTHHRRDVAWAGRALVAAGTPAVVPAGERADFAEVAKFWSDFTRKRFHDYTHKSSKVLGEPIPVARTVRGGDTLDWEGLSFRVLDTPGYSPGAVSYLVDLDGQRIAFTGDLIYGDGKVFDLYSLQDAIPEAKMMAYHGYAARLADVLTSLARLAAERPTLLVPGRGPIIRNPAETIVALTARARAFYANYLFIDAHRYYLPEDRFLAKARRVLGLEAKVAWMPPAATRPLPPWVVPIDNARLILAADKTGFLVDCGSPRIIGELKKLQAAGRLTSIEHIFVTHYHDDHTDQVAQAAKLFGATVHASEENREVLRHPAAWRLPCLTTEPIEVTGHAKSGSRWRWKEFEMTLAYFPGQTLHHDALLVKRDGGETFFFIGDSFTPAGIDDYCLLNRNFLHEGMGYFRCLETVKREAPEAWLINQHVAPAFRFSTGQLEEMLGVLRRRAALLQALLPWDDPNFGLDEGWARFHPYAVEVRPGQPARLSLRIWNHSSAEQTFLVRPRLPQGWASGLLQPLSLRVPARAEGAVDVAFVAPANASAGLHLVTADVSWGDWELREWTEAMVTVTQRPTAENP
jgi:glyoxylase-like metal-dependent hydrolase (beta-lactamase superfamily II)